MAERFSGQTVDELLLLEGTKYVCTILFALEEAVQCKVDATSALKLTGIERTLLSVMPLLREVQSLGYEQFFRRRFRRFTPAIVDELVRVGLHGNCGYYRPVVTLARSDRRFRPSSQRPHS